MNIRGNIFCATAIFLFALGFPAANQLLQTWGIIILIALRNFLALLVVAFLMFLLERNVAFLKLPWAKGFWIGGIGFGFGSLLLLIAQAMTDATTAALAAAAMPIFAVGLEVALDGSRGSGHGVWHLKVFGSGKPKNTAQAQDLIFGCWQGRYSLIQRVKYQVRVLFK